MLDKTNGTFPTNSAIPQIEFFVKKYARNLFTLLGKSFNQFLNDLDVTYHSAAAGSTPPALVGTPTCMSWVRKNVLNTSNLDEPFSFHYLNRIGPFCGVKVSGKALSGATTYSIQLATTANTGSTTLQLSNADINNNISHIALDMLARHPAIPEHTLVTGINVGANTITLNSALSSTINAGTVIEFDYSSFTATADVFVQSIFVDPNHLVGPGNNDGFNVDLNINPRKVGTNQYLEINFSGKKASGRIAAIAKVDTLQPVIAQAAAPIGSRFAFFDDDPNTGTLYEKEGTAIGFNLNDADPNFTKRNVYTTLTPFVSSPNNIELLFHQNDNTSPYYFQPFTQFLPYGSAGNSICFTNSNKNSACGASCPSPSLIPTCNNTNPGPLFPTTGTQALSLNPNTLEWSDSISVFNINVTQGDDIITNILNSLARVQIEKLKPKLLQLAIKDVLDRLVTKLLKTIFDHIEAGIRIPLFNSLPEPFKNLRLLLKAQVTKVGTNETGTNTINAMEAEANISLLFEKDTNECNPCPWEGGITFPPTTQPVNGRSLLLKDAPVPSIYSYKAVRGHDGLLLAIHPDVVNQALHNLWKIGALNLTIDGAFRASLIAFASQNNVALIQLLNYVSTGRSIRTILAPTKDSIEGRDTSNQPILVEDNDEIIYKLNWLLPPIVKGAFTKAQAFEVPRLDLKIGDLEVFINGRKTAGPNIGTVYTIAYLKVSMNSRMDIDISIKAPTSAAPWNLPATQGWNDYRNTIKLSFSTDPRDIRYVVEPGEPNINVPDRNPIGQDPKLLIQVLEPLVKTFIVPMLNDILNDITIEETLEYCGLGLYNLQLVPVDITNPDPPIMIHSLMYDYNFTGDCNP